MMQEKYKESENHLLSCSSDVTVLASVLPGTHSHGQPYVSRLIPHVWVYPLPPPAPMCGTQRLCLEERSALLDCTTFAATDIYVHL